MTISRLTATALAVLAALVFAACGEKTLDTADAEDEISDKLQEQGRPKPDKVECPDDMTAEKGKTYTCKLTAGEDELDVKLTMLDDDGKFEFEVPAP
jgi:DNA-binding transcriptional regulator WhiA